LHSAIDTPSDRIQLSNKITEAKYCNMLLQPFYKQNGASLLNKRKVTLLSFPASTGSTVRDCEVL